MPISFIFSGKTKNDIFKMDNDFFLNNIPPENIGLTYIVLIPKSENANRLNHFHPISLCNAAYKNTA